MNKNNIILLVIGVVLMLFGFFAPSIKNNVNVNNDTVNVVAPLDPSLKNNCEIVIKTLIDGSSDRKIDGPKLSSLYADIAKLISLDETNEVIKNTDEIRDCNRLAGLLYDLDLKDKYPNLASVTNNVIVDYIGNDNVGLDPELRKKAVEAFNGLSWAFYEGSK